MKRRELEHIIRAAAEVVFDEIVVIGSQAVIGQADDLPAPVTVSMKADVYPLHHPERAIEIDGALGEGSGFHEQFGYYAHGVGPETPHAPAGWEGRVVTLALPPTGGWKRDAVAHLMEMHDVILAKLVAGRTKDFDFAEASIRDGLVDVGNLRRGLDLMNVDDRPIASRNLEIVLARISL